MNIKDLKPDQYQVVSTPTNVNQLKPGSYSVKEPLKQKDHGFLGNVAAGIAKPFARLGTNIAQAGQGLVTGKQDVQPFSGDFLGDVKPVGMEGSFGKKLKDSIGTGLEVASNIPIGGGAVQAGKTGLKGLALQTAKQGAKYGATAGGLQGLGGALQDDKGLGETALSTAGGGLLGGVAGGVLGGVAGTLGKITPGARIANKFEKNVNALDPDLAGKAKVSAYKEVTSGRGIKPAGIFQEQGLSPNERTLNLAKRLSNDTGLSDGSKVKGVKFGKNPLKNLKIIGQSLDETEKSLTNALKNNISMGDSSVSYHLDKPTLTTKLDAAKTQAPREFQTIRESKNTFINVMDFAKEKIMEAEDSIDGGRQARTAFDAQARKEYPSVFKDGYIDTSTPAGSAIKKAREVINQHIYESAPNGSDIQNLVGREADLLNARDISAIKASKFHGADWFDRLTKTNPKLAKSLKYTLIGLPATAAVGYGTSKALQAFNE